MFCSKTAFVFALQRSPKSQGHTVIFQSEECNDREKTLHDQRQGAIYKAPPVCDDDDDDDGDDNNKNGDDDDDSDNIIMIMMMMPTMMMMMMMTTMTTTATTGTTTTIMMIIIIIIIIINNDDDDDDDDDDDNNGDDDDDDNDNIQRRNSRLFFTISSLRRELSPICTLNWPGSHRVQITCNTSSNYHVQHVMLRATWYTGTAQLLILTEFKSHLL